MASAESPREEDPSSRERILEAALSCFSECGFEGATTREIARRAGVNLGLIKYYFDGKERLWQEAVARTFEELGQGLGAALREAGPFDDRGQMRQLMRRYVHWVARHPEFIRLMHEEGKRDSPRMHWLVDQHVRPFFAASMDALRAGQGTGFLPAGIDAVHFHYILIGAVALVFHQGPECQRLSGCDPSDESFVEAHADAVIHLFLGPQDGSTGTPKETPA